MEQHAGDGAPAALYLPPAAFDALALSEDCQLACASGGAAVVLSASRLASARTAACVDAASPSLPPSTGPPIADAGGEPVGPDRGIALGWHLRARELADGGGGGGDGETGAGGEDGAPHPTSAPPVRALAWSPAGAAPGGGCLLVLLAGGDQVHVLAPPRGEGRWWAPVWDAGDALRRGVRAARWGAGVDGGGGPSSDDDEDEGGGGGGGGWRALTPCPGPPPPDRAAGRGVLDLSGLGGGQADEEEEGGDPSPPPSPALSSEHSAGEAAGPSQPQSPASRKRGRDGGAGQAAPPAPPPPPLSQPRPPPSTPGAAAVAAWAAPALASASAPLPVTPPPIPPPGTEKAALRTAWEAAYLRFLWTRATGGGGRGAPPPPEAYARGQHLRGLDANAADAAAALLTASHGAALRSAGASGADVTRELKAAVRRRLLGRLLEEAAAAPPPPPGEDDDAPAASAASTSTRGGRRSARPTPTAVLTQAVYAAELRAVLAAGEDVTPYGRGPGALAAGPPAPRKTAGRAPSTAGTARTAAADAAVAAAAAADVSTVRRAGGGGGGRSSAAAVPSGGAALAAAEAVRRAAALRPASLAWSPGFQQAGSAAWASVLAIGSGDGCVWAWRCEHPHPTRGDATHPRFTPLGGVRAFGGQAASALTFAGVDAGGDAPGELVLVAGGGRGSVAVLTLPPTGPARFSRARRLARPDGRAVACLAARLEAGGDVLLVGAGKAGGRTAAWRVSGWAGGGRAPRPPSPATADAGDARTVTAAAWLPSTAVRDARTAVLCTSSEDGKVRLWSTGDGGGPCLSLAAEPAAPGGGHAAAAAAPALRLPVFGAAVGAGGLRIATVSSLASALTKDAGASKTMTFSSLERAAVRWCRPAATAVSGPPLAPLPDAAVAAAAALRSPGGHATSLLAELAAVLRGQPDAGAAVLAVLEGPALAAMAGARAQAPAALASLTPPDWLGLRRACALRRALAFPGPPPPSALGTKAGTGTLGEVSAVGGRRAGGAEGGDGRDDRAPPGLEPAELALLARQAGALMAGDDAVSALIAADWAETLSSQALSHLLSPRPGLAAFLRATAAAAAKTYARLKARPASGTARPPAREGGHLPPVDTAAPPWLAARASAAGGAPLPTPRCAGTWKSLPPSARPAACHLCGRLQACPAPGDEGLHGGAPVCGVCGVLTGSVGRCGGWGWPGLP